MKNKEKSENLKVKLEINSKTLMDNRPLILKKKLKKLLVKPLKRINSDTGQTRHFTPATQEWYNSLYTYNKNYIKSLPTADKSLMTLLKGYFNSYVKDDLLYMKKKIRRVPNRYRRLSAKKIFVGKGDIKHTSNKVIITFYVYNTEAKILLTEYNKLYKSLKYPSFLLKKFVNSDKNNKETIIFNRPFSLKEFLSSFDKCKSYFSYLSNIINKVSLLLNKNVTSLAEIKLLSEEKKPLIFNNVANYTLLYLDFNSFMVKMRYKYLENLRRLRYLLMFNKAKFKRNFLLKLTYLVKSIYNKEIEFNIVNLKKMHLNSDIFTQAVTLKLRNRDNKLYRVLKSSLSNIKLPNISRVTEKYNKPNREAFLVNRIRNSIVNTMFIDNTTIDPLNNLLLDFYPSAENLEAEVEKRAHIIKRSITLKNYVIRNLKHTKISGVRIEAKGRLTRRFTASRSVFKMKWKGGIKNVDSSFRGLSAVILRGHVKSNIQYSMLNSKNRNGAFGVKGWVSNK